MSWTNWARTETATPTAAAPRTPEEAADVITTAAANGRTVRPAGSGHSFTGIGSPGSGVLLDLRHWTGIVSTDLDRKQVTVRAGTPLHQLNAELDQLGLAMTNLGDIDRQTLAGAISTGTHGTGARFGGLASQVVALELLLADGSLVRCSREENPDLFDAARVGLGALGVLTTITLQCEPAFHLAAEEHPAGLDEVLARFDELAETNDHFEFYWFPHSRKALVKRNNRLPADEPPQPLGPLRHLVEYEVAENLLFGAICRIGREFPRLVPPLNRLCATAWSKRSYSDRSHRVFTTARRVLLVESEYAVPRDAVHHVIAELREAVGRLEHPVMFPVEVRVAAADDAWLSTAYQRPTAYIAIHQYTGMPYRHWFSTFEDVVAEVGGRPHWGKMHRLDAPDLRELYPKFDDFRKLRAELDPAGVFRNAYLSRVLGP